jgi:hypothetical protein
VAAVRLPVNDHLSSNKLQFFAPFVEAESFRAIVRVGIRDEVIIALDRRVAKQAPANLGFVVHQIGFDCLH